MYDHVLKYIYVSVFVIYGCIVVIISNNVVIDILSISISSINNIYLHV